MKKKRIDLKDGTSIYIPIVESYKDCFELINSDQYRCTGKKASSIKLILKLLCKPFSMYGMLAWFRLSKHHGALYYVCRLFYKICCDKYHIDLPHKTKVGFGFYIGHGIDIVINGGTIIGNNVNLSQFTNIGTNKNTPAIIADNVYVGPMV